MSAVDGGERCDLSTVAARLELHPFDLVRIISHEEPMPQELLFGEAEIEIIARKAGILPWWDANEGLTWPAEDPDRTEALARALAWKLASHQPTRRNPVRADNLFRGLKGTDRRRARRITNGLIRLEVVQSVPTWRGLCLGIAEGDEGLLHEMASANELPEGLREQILL